jgi:hypothetical protein
MSGMDFTVKQQGFGIHYEPLKDSPFATSCTDESVTKTIRALPVTTKDGENIFLCYVPGFGDTGGAEVEIANCFGLIHALHRARSVKHVLVLDAEGMRSGHCTALKGILDTLLRLTEKSDIQFDAFECVFSRCDDQLAKLISGGFNMLLDQSKKCQDDPAFIAFLTDLVSKTKSSVNTFTPIEKAGAQLLVNSLLSGQKRIENPGLSTHIFAYWLLLSITDFVKSLDSQSSAKKYVRKPYPSQAVAVWLMLNSVSAENMILENQFVKVKTGKGAKGS